MQALATSAVGPRLHADTLALSGGPKAVTCPAAKTSAIMKWPRYGAEEKNAISALLDNNQWYAEIPAFEKELKDYLAGLVIGRYQVVVWAVSAAESSGGVVTPIDRWRPARKKGGEHHRPTAGPDR